MSEPARIVPIAEMPCRTVGQKRELFARCLVLLGLEVERLGFYVRWDELKRGDAQARWNATHCRVIVDGVRCEKRRGAHRTRLNPGGSVSALTHFFKPIGSRNTLHKLGLAIDGYLRRPGGRILWATEHYRELGIYWESLHRLC